MNAAIALGSNLGDRRAHLDAAVAALARILKSMKSSAWIETDPVGIGDQPRFLNGAVAGETMLSARELLDELLRIEAERGRVRPGHSRGVASGPGDPGEGVASTGKLSRTLDLDLILYGDAVIDEPGLEVPHPRFRERLFVLEPLAEVAGAWVDPVTGLTVTDLRASARRSRPVPPGPRPS